MCPSSASADPADDIEMQRDARVIVGKSLNERQLQALQCLFGYSAELLQQVPSIAAWCGYLEDCFQPLLEDDYSNIWPSIGLPKPKTSAECWSWLEAVASSIRQFQGAGVSIEDIWETMIPRTAAPSDVRITADSERSTCFIAIFAVLCWGSMTLSPKLASSSTAAPSYLAIQHMTTEHHGLKLDFVERPIAAVFRNFQRNKTGIRWRPPINAPLTGDSVVLYVSSLNFNSLQITGKLRLKWVDNITSHLDFNSRTRTLSIFRYPSFCALTTLGANRGAVFEE